MRIWNSSGRVLASVLLLTSMATPGLATDTIRLTTVSGYPATADWVSQFEATFVPEVNARLATTGNYTIDWVYGWGGAIVNPRGEFNAIEAGLADIGVVQTVFHPDRLRAFDIAYATPFVTTDIELITRVVNDLVAQFPQMTNGFSDNGQVLLTTLAAVDNYQILLNADYTGTESLRGLRISGAVMNLRYIEAVGATGVSAGLADYYNGVSSGIYDGVIAWATAAQAFRLYEAASTYVTVDFGGVNSMALSINENVWNGLPEEVQVALTESAEVYRHNLARYAMDRAANAVAAMVADGANVVDVSEADRTTWAAALPNLAQEWAAEVEATGVPGGEMLDAYIAAMVAAGQPVLRDWSAEN